MHRKILELLIMPNQTHLIYISFALQMWQVLTYIVKESDFSCSAVADKKSVVLVDLNVRTQAIAFLLLFVISSASRRNFVLHLGSIPLHLTRCQKCICLWRQTTSQD